MKKALFLLIIVCVGLKCTAQKSHAGKDTSSLNSPNIETDNRDQDPFKIYKSVDRAPKFPGGPMAFNEYVKNNIRLSGKSKMVSDSVIVSFIVEMDGSLHNIKIAKSLSTKCDSEAVRLIKLSPKWFPGIENGRPVRTLMQVPIRINDSSMIYNEKSLDAENQKGVEDELAINEPRNVFDESSNPDPERIYVSVEKPPEFPGGEKEFIKFLMKNLKWPSNADNDNFGRIILSFIVELDGSLSNLKIEKSLGKKFDAEAMRVLKMSPKWIPGVNNGFSVRVRYSLPINIEISE